jgi:hypothetical protein
MIQEGELTGPARRHQRSDADVRRSWHSGLQENGQFIGEQRYRQLLAFRRAAHAGLIRVVCARADMKFGPNTEWMSVTSMPTRRKQRRKKATLRSFVLADSFKTVTPPTPRFRHTNKNKEVIPFPTSKIVHMLNPAELAAHQSVEGRGQRNYRPAQQIRRGNNSRRATSC